MPKAFKVAFRHAANRRLAALFLLVMVADPGRPSARLMASSDDGNRAVNNSGQSATLKSTSVTPDTPFSNYDSEAERMLLDFANQSRAQAGLKPLTLDAGLSQAARAHARTMVAARQLSHQFDGEPSLPQRLAAATYIQLDQEGENVAFDYDAAEGHKHLMLSPPHRANLLNSAYNVVGMGVIRSGDRIYIVEDFGHALPNYSMAEVKDRIAATVAQARRQARQPALVRHDSLNHDSLNHNSLNNDLPTLDGAACSMAREDKLGTSPIHQLAQHSTVLTYTSLTPGELPAGADKAVARKTLRGFAIGACYSRTETYPTGVYWLVLSLD